MRRKPSNLAIALSMAMLLACHGLVTLEPSGPVQADEVEFFRTDMQDEIRCRAMDTCCMNQGGLDIYIRETFNIDPVG